MTQPDRFEKMVATESLPDSWGVEVVDAKDAVSLLRRQHKAYVRMVKRQTILAGGMLDRSVLLAAMENYGKEMP